jgi:hypothetical protein
MAHVTINNQQISWAFIQRVRKECGGCWDRTMDVFWKAKDAQGENGIIKYIVKGLAKDERGVKYALTPSKEVEEGRRQIVRDWWTREVHKPRGKEMASVKDVFRALLGE